jgi:hypothetical protein
MTLGKSVKIDESKSVQVRVDVTKIFNHPTPGGGQGTSGSRIRFAQPPTLDINATNTFGYLGTKVGMRTFQAKIRFNY